MPPDWAESKYAKSVVPINTCLCGLGVAVKVSKPTSRDAIRILRTAVDIPRFVTYVRAGHDLIVVFVKYVVAPISVGEESRHELSVTRWVFQDSRRAIGIS